MPSIKSSTSNYYTRVILIIFLLGKIILLYSRCIEKKLVYIIITALSSP